MNLEAIFFALFTAIAILGGVGVVAFRSPVRSAVSLVASLLGVAGLFLLQQAEFLFAVQIVLYIGGIMLLFLFLIMLVDLESLASQRQMVRGWLFGLAGMLILAVPVFVLIQRSARLTGKPAPPNEGNTEAIADLLLRDHAVAFELTSVLLLAAIVAAVYLARRSDA